MGRQLVLAEKPSVGRELARVLGCRRGGEGYLEGDRYVVTWALGHLVTLADPDVYEKKWEKWDMADLPMLPQHRKLVVIPQTARQFRVVQGLMKRSDITGLIIATDAGREGELVARWIMAKAGWNKPAKRLWISSQTDKAIRDGFADLRPAADYENLFRSAQARSEADWLVGLNVTRALTCKYNAQLSAGRVQTPTLALIAAREQEIRSFVPKEFYGVRLKLAGFTAVWRDANGNSRTFDRALAERIAEACRTGTCTIRQVRRMRRMTPPPAAYDLTELQRDANKKYAYSAKETLNLMQALYEQHKLLTYPRTDSRYISDDVVPTLPDRLRAVMTGDYKPFAQELMRRRPLSTRYLVNNAKVTDHHAIIPTEEAPDLWQLSGPERNIYDLVVRRFLAVLMPPCAYEEVELTLRAGDHDFTAKGRIVSEPGWRRVYDRSFRLEDEEEDEPQTLPALEQGQRLPILGASVAVGKTPPPPRYTEDTLLSAMENAGKDDIPDEAERKGLGTPATRAATIEKLVTAGFVERKGKNLIPTKAGINLVTVLPEPLTSPMLTAEWEQKLTEIAKGGADPDTFMDGIRDMVREIVSTYSCISEDGKKLFAPEKESIGACPRCGQPVYEGKKNFACSDRSCGFVLWKNDRFWTSRKKELTKKMATDLLKKGRTNVKGMWSEKKQATYDAAVILNDTGGRYIDFKLEFPKNKRS